MKIERIKLRAATGKGDFGFDMAFEEGLNIIKAGNAHGKSTAFNSIVYALGMEELIGGKGPTTLPYCVRDYLINEGVNLPILESAVSIQIKNKSERTAVFRRPIKSPKKSQKLIEVYEDATLDDPSTLNNVRHTFVHDPGGASTDAGFHRFLAEFLSLELPRVAATKGGDVPLYLQAIFSGAIVEQKRGWSDYLANLPFFGIRDARKKVIEYLLSLEVFETEIKKSSLEKRREEIHRSWGVTYAALTTDIESIGGGISGISENPSSLFKLEEVNIVIFEKGEPIPFEDYVENLRLSIFELEVNSGSDEGADVTVELARALEELKALSAKLEEVEERIIYTQASLGEIEQLLLENSLDLEKNKSTQKLMSLGAELNIEYVSSRCPTCSQDVADSLVLTPDHLPVMDVSENISYLEAQGSMLKRQRDGMSAEMDELLQIETTIRGDVVEQRALLKAARSDVTSASQLSKQRIRRQVLLESKLERLAKANNKIAEGVELLSNLSKKWREVSGELSKLPKNRYSDNDINVIRKLQSKFRTNARKFQYRSANVGDVEISLDNLTPCLANVELKQYRSNIRNDSSASDFVRLIWSYTLALFQSRLRAEGQSGNHPGFLMFDEPGQHSMSVESQRELLTTLGSEKELQSIVAASFDEDEEVFRKATDGVSFSFQQWEDFLLKPINE